LNKADLDFFSTMGGEIKEAQLDEQTISALEINQPDILDQLEGQASERVQQEQVEVASEKGDVQLQIPKGLFKNSEVHPLRLAAVLKFKYNDEWVGWLPETLWESIRKDIGSISEVNQNKVQALATALSTDSPWLDWTTFENCGRAFNNTIPIFGQIQPLSSGETAFTIQTLKKLHNFPFSQEVLGYIASVCLYNGIIFAPTKWFGKIQWMLDAQNKDKSLKPKVEKAWKTVEKQDLTQVEFNDVKPVDVHITKLWAIKQYLGDKDSQLKEA